MLFVQESVRETGNSYSSAHLQKVKTNFGSALESESESTGAPSEKTDGQKGQPEKKQNKSKNTRKLTIAARQCFKEFKKDDRGEIIY